MIRDFLDKGARTHACNHTWLDVTFAAAPATAASVLAVSDQLTKWLSYLPTMTLIVHAALPALATAATAYMVVSKQPCDTNAGFVQGGINNGPALKYRFCTAARQTAKFTFALLLVVAVASLWVVIPNRLRGMTTAAGYICVANGHALHGSFVQLHDRYGDPVSTSVATDDRGFFFTKVAQWKTRPVHIRVTGNCQGSGNTYTFSSASRGYSCPGERVESPQTGEAPVWITSCQ